MVTTKTLRLDVTKKYTEPIYLVQYEVDARILDIYLSAGSLSINLTGASVVFYAKKPDGTILFNNCTVVDAVSGHVVYTVTEQMCAVAGDLRCWILVIKDDAELRSIEFAVTVKPSEDDTEAIESTSEFTALDEALAAVASVVTYDGASGAGNIPIYADANGNKIEDSGLSIDSLKAEILLAAHPVGSYYWSDDPTSPEELFGGTWEQVKDVFILAAGDTYTAGATGGEATHTLTIPEMPSHNHGMPWNSTAATGLNSVSLASGVAGTDYSMIQNTGGGQPHNNMPPYRVAYCWRRTA